MIKLANILKELKSMPNFDGIDTSKPFTMFWSDGDLAPAREGGGPPWLSMKKTISMQINTKLKQIKIFDYDDWSSFKDILRMQQAVKDLIRATPVNDSWKITITMTKLDKNIGSFKVKDFINYDASFTKTIPAAFHGTTTRELKSIQSLGVVPPSATDREMLKWDAFYGPDSQDKTYWSIDFSRAEYYAGHAVQQYKEKGIKSKPIVIEIRDWPISNITADDDFQSNMSQLQLVTALMTGKKIDANNPITSIRSTAQFAIKGRIPANKIVKIHKL